MVKQNRAQIVRSHPGGRSVPQETTQGDKDAVRVCGRAAVVHTIIQEGFLSELVLGGEDVMVAV